MTAPHVSPPTITIGRGESNTVVVPPSYTTVSRAHAALIFREQQWVIADLGSKNGTYVNDQRITTETPLKYGDRIRLALSGIEYVFPDDFDLPVPVPPPPPPPPSFQQQFTRTLARITRCLQPQEQEAPNGQPSEKRAEAASPSPKKQGTENALRAYFQQLCAVSPRSAIWEAWRLVETALRHRYQEIFWRSGRLEEVSLHEMIDAIGKRKLLTASEIKCLHDLRTLRNKAVHHTMFAVTSAQADAYFAQCLRFAARIDAQSIERFVGSTQGKARDARM